MIFEKKVIIGSITSFVFTAIGIIAIFFPDLFNLQKDKIKEFSILLYDQEDAQKLYKFLGDNLDKAVTLDIGYCSSGEDAYSVSENPTEYPENEKPKSNLTSFVINSTVAAGDGWALREEGSIHFLVQDEFDGEKIDIYYSLDLPEASDDGDKYTWTYDGMPLSFKYSNNKSHLCKRYNDDEYPPIGNLSGTFFVTPGIFDESVRSNILKPLSKMELKMKNY